MKHHEKGEMLLFNEKKNTIASRNRISSHELLLKTYIYCKKDSEMSY